LNIDAGTHRGAYRVAGGVKTCERAFVIGVHPGIVQGSNAWGWLAAENLGYRKQQSWTADMPGKGGCRGGIDDDN
jgi:hypothetical protein